MDNVVRTHPIRRHHEQKLGVTRNGKGVAHLPLVDAPKSRNCWFKFEVAQVFLLQVILESAKPDEALCP